MNFRLAFAALSIIVLSACNDVTGQKDRTNLKTTADSVSFGIGNDVGNGLRNQLKNAGLLDSLNLDLMAKGIRQGLDSTVLDSAIRKAVQQYQIGMQKKAMAAEQQKGEVNMRAGEEFLATNGKRPEVKTTASGLQYEVLQMGTGPKPTATDKVRVNYKGSLIDGSEFDSSYKRGQPAEFEVGQVIPGWTEALQLMPVGSRWKVYIPSTLGYGPQAQGDKLPAYSTLIFEVELLDIVKQ